MEEFYCLFFNVSAGMAVGQAVKLTQPCCDRGKQSQLLVLGLSLEFDNIKPNIDPNEPNKKMFFTSPRLDLTFWTKTKITITTTTTAIEMGFDTIEINLVIY